MIKIIVIPVKFNTGNAEIDKMLLSKELLSWVQLTSKLLANMGQVYNVIIRKCINFTRSKLESLKYWEAML